MATEPAYPECPGADLEGWRLDEESVDTVFRLPGARVLGATRQYEDERTRRAVCGATEGSIDRQWRFFAATRLAFSPSLPPGTLPSVILPTIRNEARRSFEERLRDRGLIDVERGRSERVRVESGAQARLSQYDAVDPLEDVPGFGDTVPVAGWVGAWNDGTDFFVVTGGYPAVRLCDVLPTADNDPALARTPNDARSELLSLFRTVR